ncbi:MAG TPA: hypothetical protein PKY59_10485 [Pyrinomonadaceae bacterium]|nr:hypothetical protein [Pyrinomonadaceae bacterium]
MKRQFKNFYAIILFTLFFSAVGNVAAQNPYRVSDRQVRTLLDRIDTKSDRFKSSLDTALDRSRLNNTEAENRVNGYVEDFTNSTAALRNNFNGRRSVSRDVSDVLNRASFIDQFMRENRLNNAAQNQWNSLKTDLNTLANYYSVTWNWNNPVYPNNPSYPTNPNYPSTGNVPYRVSDSTVNSLLSRIESRTDSYRRELNNALDRSYINNTRSEDSINSYVTDFETATDRLKENFNGRRSTSNDVQDVLTRASYIDGFMRDYRLGTATESQWTAIRNDLNTLAGYYNVAWNWNSTTFPNNNTNAGLNGTYRLNTAQSDNVSAVLDSTINQYYNGNQRENARRNLERRLTSPDMLAIERRGNSMTVASTLSPQVTFQVDGTTKTETLPNGRTIRVSAVNSYDGIAITTEGDRINDFYVNFLPLSNGQLRVVRRVYLENRNETVTVQSIYDKTDNVARWNDVNNNNNGNWNNNGSNNGTFYIPNGTRLTARLNSVVDTRNSQDGDRVSLEVTSPSQYNGAIIEGRVINAEKSGRVSGRAQISLDFDSIRLRNGQTYRFAGIIDSVRAANGDNVSVNNEGAVRDSNQTTKTVTRAGIGAALGAIIGAIAGGGQGAAVGAAIGAGAGAGTVILQGKDNIELGQGTEFSITASAPNSVR